MSKTVDERVVEMRFDNKNFEKNVSQSMSTLDKLKQKLHLDGEAKGLENVGAASQQCASKMAPLGAAVDSVKTHFSAMEVIGVTALMNITNSVVNAGKRIVSALTVQPVSDGYSMYEKKLNAIQVMMSSTGESMDYVKSQIADLNEYSNKTIYRFSDMTDNVGKFTNAGIGLKESVMAIKGISNEAALAGANTNECSRAMYNLAQSLAVGHMQLIDWKSIENANMATKDFKNQLIDTALEMGVLTKTGEHMGQTTKGTDVTFQSFNNTLQDQWLTTDVLMTTLKKYSDETTELGQKAYKAAKDIKSGTQLLDVLAEEVATGWADTFEIIFGDLDQAKKLWGGVYEFVGGGLQKITDARNNFFKGLATSKWDKFSRKLSEAGVDIDKFKERLIDAGKESGAISEDMGVSMDTFADTLSKGWLTGDLVVKTLKSFSNESSNVTQATEDMTSKLEYFQKVVDEVWHGDHDDGEARIKDLESKGYEYAKVQDLVNKTVDGHRLTIEDLSDAQLENIGCTQEQIDALHQLQAEAEATGTPLNDLINSLEKPSGRELVIETIGHAVQNLGKALGSIRQAFAEVFTMDEAVDGAYSFLEVLHGIVMNINFTDEDAENLKDTFKGLFTVLKLFTDLAGGGVMLALKGLNFILGAFDLNILDVTGAVGKAVYNFGAWLKSSTLVSNALKDVKNGIIWLANGLGKLKDKLMSVPIIQQMIEKLHARVTDFFENSDDYFDAGKEKVAKWVGAFKALPLVSGAIANVKASFADGKVAFEDFIGRASAINDLSFENVTKIIGDFCENVIDKFVGFGNGVDGFQKSCGGIKTSITELSEKVFPKFTKTGGNAKFASENVATGIQLAASKTEESGSVFSNAISGIHTVLKGFTDWVSSEASKINFGEILATAFGTTFIIAAVQVFKFTKAITNMVDGIGNVLDSVSNVVNNFAKGVRRFMKDFGKSMKNVSASMKYKAIGNMVWNIAKAFVAVAGALLLLSKIDNDGLTQALMVLGLVVASMAGLVYILSKYPVKDTIKVSGVLMSMAGAVVILSVAMKMLAGLDFTSAVGACVLLGALLLELIVAVGLINKIGPSVDKSAGIMIGISASMLIISLAVSKLASLDFSKALGAVILLEILMITMSACLFLIGLTGTASKKGAAALILMAGAMLLLTMVIKIVSKFTLGEIVAAIGVMAMMGVLIGATVLLMKLIGDSGKYAAKAGAMMLAFGLALLAMVTAIKVMAGMSLTDIAKGSLAIVAFAVACGILVAFTKSSGQYATKAAAVVLAFGVAMLALSVSLFILSSLDTKGLVIGSIVVAGLIGMLTMLVASTRYASNASKTIIAVAIVIGTMAAVIAILSMMDTEKVLAGTLFVTAIMGMVALLVNAKGMSKEAMKSVVLITAVVAAIGGILYLMNGMNAETALATAGAISMILLSMSVACALLAEAGEITPTALAAIGILTLIVAGIGGILWLMQDMNISSTLVTAEAISLLLISLSAALVLLEVAGLGGPAALIGIGSLVVLIIAMGDLMLAIGALNQLLGDAGKKFIEDSIPILELIGEGIGTFFGAIVEGFLGTASKGIVEVGKNLSLFMFAIQPFLLGLKMVGSSTLEGAKSLAEMILILSAAELINGIASWLTGRSSMTDFADQLVPFGKAMVAFSAIVKDRIDEGAVTAAANAGKMMAEMAKTLPNSGGVAGFFAGENDMDDFGKQLIPFGLCMVAFSAIVKDRIDEGAVTAAANAGKLMSEMASTIPNTGGVVSFFTGDNRMDAFGAQLVIFGGAIVAFSAIVKDKIDTDSITAAANAGSVMSAMQETVPKTMGVVDFFTGSNNLALFGTQLVLFGDAIVAFSNKVKDNIDAGAVESAALAGSVMAELANNLPESNGIFDWLTGDGHISMNEFGTQLEGFGDSIAKYSDAVKDVNPDAMKSAGTASAGLVELAKAVPDECNLSGFGDALYVFGDDLSGFYNSVSDIDSSVLSDIITQSRRLLSLMNDLSGFDGSGVNSFSSSLTSFANSGLDSFVSAFNKGSGKISSAGSNVVSALAISISSNSGKVSGAMSNLVSLAITTLKNKQGEFYQVGKMLIGRFGSGIESGRASVISSIRSVLGRCVSTLRNEHSNFYNAGTYLVIGFSNGITSGTWRVEAKSKAMAKVAYDSAMKELDAHSPSKKFKKVGSYVPAGFAIGIESLGYKVKAAASSMADTAIDAMGESINLIGEMVNSDMDTTPTIRPVLDLSDIQNGAGSIGGMLGGSYGISAMANSIASGSAGKTGTSNGDVVSAINRLRKDIGGIQGNTYNIDGITYDNGSEVSDAIETLVRATRVGRRV